MMVRLNKVTAELTEENELNRSLMKNQAQWQTKVTNLEAAMSQKEKVRYPIIYLFMHNKH